MHKRLILMALSGLLCPALLSAQQGARPEQTVPFTHWAYDACEQISKYGIIIGYPDGTWRGDRPLTRYEFAMAVTRLIDLFQGQSGLQQGKDGPPGPPGKPASVSWRPWIRASWTRTTRSSSPPSGSR